MYTITKKVQLTGQTYDHYTFIHLRMSAKKYQRNATIKVQLIKEILHQGQGHQNEQEH